MDSLYDRLLREFQRLRRSSGPGEIFVRLPSIPRLTITWENDAVDMIYGDQIYYSRVDVVWMLHVPKEGKPKLAASHIQEGEDVLQDVPDERAESMAATLLEQLAKVKA